MNKIFFSILLSLAMVFATTTSAFAATRYVNSDSSGAATNPTRPFSDANYTPNDSYSTFQSAYSAAVAGDTIELSGGTSGKSYQGASSSLAKQLTVQGSSISGHKAPVTITYNSSSTYAIGANADNIVLQNLIISGSNTGKALHIFKNNITVKNVILKDAGGDAYHLTFNTPSTSTTNLTNLVILGNVVGRGIYMGTSTGTANFYNCNINAVTNVAISVNTGATANFTNCAITSSSTINGGNVLYYNSSGVINTYNSFIQGAYRTPHVLTQGAGTKTWNSSSDIINDFPYFSKTKADLGYIALSVDDRSNISYFKPIADYAMTNHGIPMSMYVSDTQNLTSTDKLYLQSLYKSGHEIGLHTRHHSDLYFSSPFKVTYSGTNTNMAVVVSASGTSLSVTGSSETHGPIDLTSPAYDTVGEVCSLISTWTHFSCSMNSDSTGSVSGTLLSNSLKDLSTSLPIGTSTAVIFDDSTGPDNRYYKEEITNAIADLETAIHEDPLAASYSVKTIAFPYNSASNSVINWIQANTGLIGARSNDRLGTALQKLWLGSINVFNIYERPSSTNMKGPNYSTLTAAQKELRIKQAARVMAGEASNGIFTGILVHTASDFTQQEYQWFLDELSKYRSVNGVNISSFVNLIGNIKTSGSWANAGGGIWTRSFAGDDNLLPKVNSPLINAGKVVTGRTTDILGNPIVGLPDIGAYEFQPVSNLLNAPTLLQQYKADGTTVIPLGGWINESGVLLQFSMSSGTNPDTLTPMVEIKPHGTNFTGLANNFGSLVSFVGVPVAGKVSLTGLVDGSYHWQAAIKNAADILSPFAINGGSPDFGIDTVAPTTPLTKNKPTWAWEASTDLTSGLASAAYTVNWCGDASFVGCEQNVATVNTNSFTHSTALSSGTWYLRVMAHDKAGNSSAYKVLGTSIVE